MINILITIAVVIGSAVSAFGILSVCNLLNIQKEYRFKQHSHVKFLIYRILKISHVNTDLNSIHM